MPDLLDPADSGRGDRQIRAKPEGLRKNEGRRTAGVLPGPPLLLCERVSKWYGPVIGVNQVTLELRPGVTGLVGANGAGKSTLMRLITGQLRPDIGRVTVKGFDAWGSAAKRHVGYCPETDAFYEEMSGRRFVETMARLCGYPRPEALRRAGLALEQVGMAGRAEHRLRGYSKGMRQRIKLAQALVHDPDVLVLDEPLSGIDPVGRSELVALFQDLSARGKCLLVSSHELDELEKLTDLVAIMARGCIAVIDTVARIRDRLDDHPLTIRIVVEPDRNGANVVAPGRNGAEAIGAAPNREFAAALLRLPDVVSVELLPAGASQEHPGGPVTIGERPAGGVLVRARNPQRFFRDLTRLALEEWYEIRHLETLDDSAGAVLGYLLGGSGGR